MNAKQAKELKTDEVVLKRLAKYMALYCFRNTQLENLHCGTSPNSQSGDFSDVKVVSPYGEIPWTKLSRISDAEMKDLMIDVVNKTYFHLAVLFGAPDGLFEDFLASLRKTDPQPNWNEPVLPIRTPPGEG